MAKVSFPCLAAIVVVSAVGCQPQSEDHSSTKANTELSQSTPSESKPAESESKPPVVESAIVAGESIANSEVEHEHRDGGPGQGSGMGRGMGRGMGMGMGMGMGKGPGGMDGGPGAMGGMRGDMTTLHAMFADRDKITRTIKNLPDGAEATTESDDESIAALLKEHVPAMEERVVDNKPLPPMTFHPIFVELIKHAKDYTLTYEETEKGMKVKYHAETPYVVMLVQEHAKLVSRFIQNGMEEVHKPYSIPSLEGEKKDDVPVEK